MKVIIRDLDEATGFEFGEFEVSEIEALIRLFKEHGGYYDGNTLTYHSSQFVPEEKYFEIIVTIS
ncbi:MAG: hypothetical protein WDA59_00095 [Methanofastidiosum sp.]|jgi:hypothetical protein